jgi:hypothetical protein
MYLTFLRNSKKARVVGVEFGRGPVVVVEIREVMCHFMASEASIMSLF